MYIPVQVFVCVPIFNALKYILRSGIAGSYDNSMFNFLRNLQLLSAATAPFTFPPARHESSSFFTSLPTHYFPIFCCYFLFFIIAILVGVKYFLGF